MTAAVAVEGVSKNYRSVTAVDNVTFSIRENAIYGLLGRTVPARPPSCS